MLHEQHPVYGGMLINDKQALEKFFTDFDNQGGIWIIFPECIATNGKCWITLCFIDYNRGFVLFRKKLNTGKKITIVNTNYPLAAEVGLASLLITGLNPVPIDDEGNFEQIDGPIKYVKTHPDSRPSNVIKFLYVISDFNETLKNPEEFIWVKASLVPSIFEKNNFFKGDRFDSLLEIINKIDENQKELKL